MNKRLVKTEIYRWTDYIKPRWIVLDMQGTRFYFKRFWTENGARRALLKFREGE